MAEQNNKQMVKKLKVTAIATDPIYIGTGGYTIGRVDNTIVRDPITRLPKIPGSSLAGTWRYYMALELQKYIKDQYRDFQKRKEQILNNNEYKEKGKKDKLRLILEENSPNWVKNFDNNLFSRITCAGQDNLPQLELAQAAITIEEGKTGHCGHCIVCKSFGFSKKDISWQGMLFFSDLEILLFPVFTRLGTRWITTVDKITNFIKSNDEQIRIKFHEVNSDEIIDAEREAIFARRKDCDEKTLNLGWLNLPVKGCWIIEDKENEFIDYISKFGIEISKILVIHEDLFSQIVNSNLEVRTSVSIDPLTGAAKPQALFTSEAIPRGTVFTGEIRIFEKDAFKYMDNKIGELPSADCIVDALCDSKHYYESLGIGGMTTRGFGRMKIDLDGDFNCNKHNCKSSNEQNQTEQTQNQ